MTYTRVGPLLIAVVAFALYSSQDAAAKILSLHYPLSMILAGNAGFALLPIGWMAWRSGGWSALRTKRPALHGARALLVLLNISLAFTSYRLLPLTNAYAIAFSAPFFITIGSTLFLGEPVGWRRWSAIVVGFVGVLIALRPDGAALELGALTAISAALTYSMSSLLMRHMRLTETRDATIFYPTAFIFVVASLYAGQDWLTLRAADLPVFALCGLCNGVAQICFATALRSAPAASVAPFQYTQMLWGTLYGIALFGDVPGRSVVLGGVIVIGSGLYVFHREAVRGSSALTSPAA
ncbi:DMT family transporter [Roseiterribacter gracilis]|uniref:DMT transporter permease n=1 Tax=Roseiterribacter gracilis TaxID=2812848 RepID=A0A8S8X7E5_9PROT|nr:DMT transporter permease [Rhodospirillales bacterium TMPK1]